MSSVSCINLFSNVPNEIITTVIEACPNDTRIAFTSTCKRFRSLDTIRISITIVDAINSLFKEKATQTSIREVYTSNEISLHYEEACPNAHSDDSINDIISRTNNLSLSDNINPQAIVEEKINKLNLPNYVKQYKLVLRSVNSVKIPTSVLLTLIKIFPQIHTCVGWQLKQKNYNEYVDFLKTARHLNHLNIFPESEVDSYDLIEKVIPYCPKLKILDLSSYNLTFKERTIDLPSIPSHPLHTLKLHHGQYDFQALNILLKNYSFKTIDIKNCSIRAACQIDAPLSEVKTLRLISKENGLESAFIHRPYEDFSKIFLHVLKNASNLEELSISNCFSINKNFQLEQIHIHLRKVSLHKSIIKPEIIEKLLAQCPGIRSLHFIACRFIKFSDIKFDLFQNIEELSLIAPIVDCGANDYIEEIKFKHLEMLLKKLPKLNVLHIQGYLCIRDLNFKNIKLEKLREVSFDKTDIQAHEFIEFLSIEPNLQRVSLQTCRRFYNQWDADDIMAPAKQYINIEELHLGETIRMSLSLLYRLERLFCFLNIMPNVRILSFNPSILINESDSIECLQDYQRLQKIFEPMLPFKNKKAIEEAIELGLKFT